MSTPVLRENQGGTIVVTTANSIANNAYANVADALRINNTSLNALYVDFWLTGATFGTAPVGGTVQLYAVDRTQADVQGPNPNSVLVTPRIVGNLSPIPTSSNSSTTWTMSLPGIQLTADCDYYLYNNGTGYTIASGCVLTAQPWSPGT